MQDVLSVQFLPNPKRSGSKEQDCYKERYRNDFHFLHSSLGLFVLIDSYSSGSSGSVPSASWR